LGFAAVVALGLAGIGATVGYIVRDRGARQTELREGTQLAVDRAEERQRKGHWGEARAILDQALERVGSEGPVDLRSDLRERLRLLDLVARLDQIRLDKAILVDGKQDLSSADPEYAEAFRDAGLGEVGDDPETVAQRISVLPIRVQIVAALDDWTI